MSALDRAVAAQALLAADDACRRLDWWARSFQGVRPRIAEMVTPPAISIGGSVSTINGNVGTTVSARWDSGRMTLAGPAVYVSDGASPSRAVARVQTLSDGVILQSPIQRARFITDAPTFEAAFKSVGVQVNAIIDGQIIGRTRGVCTLPNDQALHRVKFDFGPDVARFYPTGVIINAGGTGYAISDTITLAGGTPTTPAILQVTNVSGGVITGVTVKSPGAYPATVGTFTQAATSGSGTGAVFRQSVWSQSHTSRKGRRVELLWSDATSGEITTYFAGLDTGAQDTVQPWPVSTRVPRMLAIGDSQESTFVDYTAGNPSATIAQQLGLWDNFVVSNAGGTGYVTANGVFLPWSDSRRIADIVRQAPDIVLFTGGQNDTNSNLPALTAAVTAMLNTLLDQLPNTLFVGIGPVTLGSADLVGAIAAGWTGASDQGRVRFINSLALPWISGSGRVNATAGSGNADFYVASDGVHLTQAGHDLWADIASPAVAAALLDMVG